MRNWYDALDLPMWTLGGFQPRIPEEERERIDHEAQKAYRAHWDTQRAVRRWYAAQVAAGRQVRTAELAERLGAQDDAQARAMLQAFAFDLFHLHRHLWRALKHLEAQEAGLTFEEALTAVKREERRLKRLWARPLPAARPTRLKRPRPIDYRPQVQPTAPTN